MQTCINMIVKQSIRVATQEMVDNYKDFFEQYPTSLSARFHKNEPFMKDHVVRTVYFARELCREFKVDPLNTDVMIAAAILHDIGKTKTAMKGRQTSGKFYPQTGWTGLGNDNYHSILGEEIVKAEMNLEDKITVDKIGKLIACHMSHWTPTCPQPNCLDDYIICAADYLASRGELMLVATA